MRADTVLYHHPPLMFLPPILREGLSKGDIAHHDPRVHLTAVNLTTQCDPTRLGWCADPALLSLKSAVRYVCRLREADLARLEPQRRTWARLRVSEDFQKRLDVHGQAKWWSHYFGTIPQGQFEVHLGGRAGYVTATEADLTRAAEAVEREREHYEFVSPPDAPYLVFVRPLDAGRDNWLLTDPFSADRLLAAV